MYKFPSAPSVHAARPSGSGAPASTRAGAATARGQPAPAPGAERAQRAKERPLQELTVHWQRLHSVPRGAHGRLARAAEEFARAAIAAQDTGFRRHALQSLVRELDRQHAALATRLSRERRDCPHTTQLRNWVVHVKRRVLAVMLRASAPLDAPDWGGLEDAGPGRRPPPRAAELVGDNLEQFVAEEEVTEMDAPSGADHAHNIDSDDVKDDELRLRQFAYVPGARRASQSSAGARAGRCGRQDLAAASAAGAEASLLVRGLEGLCICRVPNVYHSCP